MARPKQKPIKELPPRGLAAIRFDTLSLGLILFFSAVLIYIPAMSAGFIWDDDQELTANALLAAPDGLYKFWFANPTADYFPLKSTIQWLLFQLCGPDPVAFHMINILLHGVCVVLLWRVLLKLRVSAAWLGALLFAVHPLCADTVAWISELKNTLSFSLALATMLAFLEFDETHSRRAYFFSLLAFAMTLLAKSAAVPLPFVLLLCCFWRRGLIAQRDLFRTAPFFGMSLVLGLVTIWFQNNRAIGSEVIPIGDGTDRIAGASLALGFYIWKALCPINLMVIYPQWHHTLPIAVQLLPGLAILALVVTAWMHRQTWGRAVLFALGCFAAMLLPVLGLVQMSYMRLTLVSDHFVYYSLGAATALVAAAGVRWLSGQTLMLVAAIFVGVFGMLSWSQAKIFKGEETLWRATLEKNPDSWQAHNHYGAVLYTQGKVQEALHHFAAAVRLKPENPESHNNLALALGATGKPEQALAQYFEAVRIKGDVPALRLNLAGALAAANRTVEAVAQYREALKTAPMDPNARFRFGALLAQTGDYDGALEQVSKGLEIAPGDTNARSLLEQIKQKKAQR